MKREREPLIGRTVAFATQAGEFENHGGTSLSGCPLVHARLRHQLNNQNDDMFYSPNTLRPTRRPANRRHTDSADLLTSRVQEFNGQGLNCTWGPNSPQFEAGAVMGVCSPSYGKAKSSPACADWTAGTPDSTCDSACDETMSVMMRPPEQHKTPGAARPSGRARSRLAMYVSEEENARADVFGCMADNSWLKRAGSGGSIPSPVGLRRFHSVDGIHDATPPKACSKLRMPGAELGRLDSMAESEDTCTQVTGMEAGTSNAQDPDCADAWVREQSSSLMISEPSLSQMAEVCGDVVNPMRTESCISETSMFDALARIKTGKTPSKTSIAALMAEENCCTPPTGNSRMPMEFSTPVLRRVDSPADPKAKASSFFPTYLPQETSKTVHVIRHGESEYNAADKVAGEVRDPMIFDPHLTSLGHDQALKLKDELSQMSGLEDAVWVVSPLTRTIETFLLCCPFTERIRAAARGEAVEGKIPQIVMSPDSREHAMTSGDIGRPTSVLMREYPELAGPLSALPEIWWYHDEETHPNDALNKVFAATEPKSAMTERVDSVRKWMEQSTTGSFVLVGHSIFLKEFLAGGNRHKRHQTTLKNCEVRTTHL